MTKERLRTALFGGSFNPVHCGHLALARELLAQDRADEVWFVVSPRNPFKVGQRLAPDKLRLQLVEEALKGEPGMRATDVEFSLPRPSYTWHTLERLWRDYPLREFSLLIGADNWLRFPQWYRGEDIVSRCHITVYPREACPVDEASLPPHVSLLHTKLYPVSSTMIRERVAHGLSIEGLVPERIEKLVAEIYSKPLSDETI